MFYVIIILFIAICVGAVKIATGGVLPRKYEPVAFILACLSGFFAITFLVSWPVVYLSELGSAQEFKSVQQTVDTARERGDGWENATLQLEVVKANRWLAQAQYWSSTVLEPMYPDEIMQLRPIE